MTFLKILFLFFFTQMIFTFQTQAQDDTLPSPYFIDDVHCENLKFREISESWLFPKDKVNTASQIKNRKDCEMVFKHFGINKLEWIPVEELELFTERIKRSGYLIGTDK